MQLNERGPKERLPRLLDHHVAVRSGLRDDPALAQIMLCANGLHRCLIFAPDL